MYGMTFSKAFSGAGITALGLAAARSVESSRVDRLIDDPFARTLFEAAESDLPMRTEWPASSEVVSDTEALHLHGSRYIGMRTRFYDDALIAAMAAGVRQVVLLGAGLDTRSVRLSLPTDLALYELDQPGVLDFKGDTFKAHGVRARCGVSRIGVDLTGPWDTALHDAGLAAQDPTLWIAEGLLPYLPAESHEELADRIDALSGPDTTWTFDQIRGGDVNDLSRRSGIDMESLLASTSGEQSLVAHLATRGWPSETTDPETLAKRYRRDLNSPFTDPTPSPAPWLHTAFVSARKQSRSTVSDRRPPVQ